MSRQDPHGHERPGTPAEPEPARMRLLALIERLRERSEAAVEPEQFVRELLEAMASVADATYAAYWLPGDEGEFTLAAELLLKVSGEAAHQWLQRLKELAADTAQQRIVCYRRVPEPAGELLTGEAYVAVGFPAEATADAMGCVSIVVGEGAPALSDAGVALLSLLAQFGALRVASSRAEHFQALYGALSSAWDILAEALAFDLALQMAQVLVDKARSQLGAARVSLGFVSRRKVRVVAISGEDIVDRRTNTARLLQAAQAEVQVSGETGHFDAGAPDQERARQLTRCPQHERLARSGGSQAVHSVPLRRDERLVGVWTFEFGESAFSEEKRQVVHVLAGQVGPVLGLALENDRGVPKRVADGLASAGKWLFGREHPWRKVAAVVLAALVLFGVFGRVHFSVSGSCRLAPAELYVYAAPFDATIEAAPVRPGDTVEPGQVLVEFERDELELRLREALSNRSSQQAQARVLLDEGKTAQYAEARARLQALDAEVQLLEDRLARTTLRARVEGIVIAGDLRQDIGRPVQMGEQLVEVAPLDRLLLEMRVAQGDVTYVEPGQPGTFTTKAQPGREIQFKVGGVRPLPETQDAASYYIAEAIIPASGRPLRPGMEGAARVRVGRRHVTWVLTRQLVDWVRLHVWW